MQHLIVIPYARERRGGLIRDDLVTVKWPDDKDRRDALSEMIVDCVQGLLSCKELEDYLWCQDDERLTTKIVVIHRHAEICRDMLNPNYSRR